MDFEWPKFLQMVLRMVLGGVVQLYPGTNTFIFTSQKDLVLDYTLRSPYKQTHTILDGFVRV